MVWAAQDVRVVEASPEEECWGSELLFLRSWVQLSVRGHAQANQIGADLPEPDGHGPVIALLRRFLRVAVGEVSAGHLFELRRGRQVDRGSGASNRGFHEERRNGMNIFWTVAGSSAPNEVLTRPGWTALAVTGVPLSLLASS